MEVGQVNPHIRYARAHSNAFWGYKLSYCYDCRLFYIKNGTGCISVNKAKYNFMDNTAIFLPGGSEYELRPDQTVSSVTILIFDFDLVRDYAHIQKSLGTADKVTFVPENVLRYEVPSEFAAPIIQCAPSLYEPLKKCTDEFLLQPAYYRETASAILKMCLMELLREHTATAVSQIANQIMDYIHGHYHETDLTNKEIAGAFNYHPHYASHLMKQATGQSLHQYLLCYRIRVAKNFLMTTDMDIKTIAWKTGFNSVPYFIKMFREHTGVTPRNYRQSNANLIF